MLQVVLIQFGLRLLFLILLSQLIVLEWNIRFQYLYDLLRTVIANYIKINGMAAKDIILDAMKIVGEVLWVCFILLHLKFIIICIATDK